MQRDPGTQPASAVTDRASSNPHHVEVRCSAAGSVNRLRTSMYDYVTSETETIRVELTAGSQPGYAELRHLRETSRGLACRGISVIVESSDRTAQRMLELAGLTSAGGA